MNSITDIVSQALADGCLNSVQVQSIQTHLYEQSHTPADLASLDRLMDALDACQIIRIDEPKPLASLAA